MKETDSLAESYLIRKFSEMKKISALYVGKINRQYDFSGFKYVENLGFYDCSNSSCLNNPSILKLKYITDLNISDTRFEKVEADTLIFNLKNLKILEISYSSYYSGNSFGQIPYSYIGNLTSIFSLKINDPNLSKIPNSWANLNNLLYLDISTEKIDSIPAFLSKKIEGLKLSIDKGVPVFDASIFEIRNLGIQLYNIVDNQLDKSRVGQLKKQIKITNKSTKEKVVFTKSKFKKKDQTVTNIYIWKHSF
ncbi:MAG: hypothetical protein PHQ74_01935 [Crocinitomicaceae bacterium]|nr:hypothetical protein [Crocinitomicaceae bacterium]